MSTQQNKPVILGVTREFILWGFKTTVRDNRNGELLDGYIVIEGNGDYELDEAREKVEKEYAKLGYTVTACEFDDSNTLRIDGLAEFRKLQKQGQCCSKCTYHINYDGSVGQQEGCEALDDSNSQEAAEIQRHLKQYGTNCPYFEPLRPTEMPKEDETDYLGEVMSMLEELEEEGGQVNAR